ncbi:MAG: hypothetical protein J0L93_00705 [Deltaproteobacteria bacterium]|nr:hypothetical protein [Deltaproteobacteria bacterium]
MKFLVLKILMIFCVFFSVSTNFIWADPSPETLAERFEAGAKLQYISFLKPQYRDPFEQAVTDWINYLIKKSAEAIRERKVRLTADSPYWKDRLTDHALTTNSTPEVFDAYIRQFILRDPYLSAKFQAVLMFAESKKGSALTSSQKENLQKIFPDVFIQILNGERNTANIRKSFRGPTKGYLRDTVEKLSLLESEKFRPSFEWIRVPLTLNMKPWENLEDIPLLFSAKRTATNGCGGIARETSRNVPRNLGNNW